MKKLFSCILVMALFFGLSVPKVHALESNSEKVFVSQRELSKDEMINIFSQGYNKIIAYNNSNDSRSTRSGTHSVTTCTQMKKRNYDWLGYSKQCFQETYTSVSKSSGSYSLSLGFGGVSFSFPVENVKNGGTTGSYALSDSEINLVKNKGYYSCLRFKCYATYAKYTSKVYDNTSGQLLQTINYDHTYTYKRNKGTGLDYYLVARTPSNCDAIRNSGYVGTSSERSSMVGWRNVSNPNSASLLPWV
ncbi:hypothetical protein [Eubacterium sp.]|uniref:hypothetical protein n=1 Tax=Eubacterium sp. TaxID=142586 RepID=UPI0025B89A12|nr:hypothetical protein [Eubacterium sp.]